MKTPNQLTATEAITSIEAGDLTAQALLRSCLERIEEREPVVGAWAHVGSDTALAHAAAIDNSPKQTALAGIPFGAKDIIDSHDMPTGYGSPIYEGHRPVWDAACIALTRAAGGTLLGKTITTEFANLTPGKTANPYDPTRTPGGSSSGSAAAVGDFMVPFSFGTQTSQSTIRPAAYCGVHGYCPSQGDFRMAGVREASGSFDRLGLFARSIEDISLVRDVLLRRPVRPVGDIPTTPPRIGFCRTSLWDKFEPAMRDAMEDAASRLSAAGARVRDFAFPDSFDRLADAHRWVSSFEFARNFTHEYEQHNDLISQRLRDGRIADGMGCSFETYRDSRAYLASCRATLPELFGDIDFLITPSAFGEATKGLDTTGPTQIGSIFTPLYLPCLSLPVFTGPSGLPMGLQMLSLPDTDERLFRQARWVENQLKD